MHGPTETGHSLSLHILRLDVNSWSRLDIIACDWPLLIVVEFLF